MIMPGRDYNAEKYRFGFNGQVRDDEVTGIGNINTALYWEYDTRLGRRWNVDPKPNCSSSNFSCFNNSPVWLSDALGDTTFNFSMETKQFTGISDWDKEGLQGALVGSKNQVFIFSFVDPENDSKAIQKGSITSYLFVTNEMIDNDLARSGAKDKENYGSYDGSKYLYHHSNITKNDGKTDFVMTSQIVSGENKDGIGGGLPSSKIYIVVMNDKLIGQNNFNFGNFMWGTAAAALGVPQSLARAGAHGNNILYDPENVGKKWYERKYDSIDDQKSINLGFDKWGILNLKKK